MRRKRYSNQSGFTIVELMIATSIFSTVVLLSTMGIVTMGKRYYKNITTTRTQETVRSVEHEISEIIRVSGDVTIQRANTTGSSGTIRQLCIGDTRFTYVIDDYLGNTDTASITNYHVMWMDKLASGSPCKSTDATALFNQFKLPRPAIEYSSNDTDTMATYKELLGPSMSLTHLDVNPEGDGLFKVEIGVAYGDKDLFVNPSLDARYRECRSINEGGQFCAKKELTSYVKKRL